MDQASSCLTYFDILVNSLIMSVCECVSLAGLFRVILCNCGFLVDHSFLCSDAASVPLFILFCAPHLVLTFVCRVSPSVYLVFALLSLFVLSLITSFSSSIGFSVSFTCIDINLLKFFILCLFVCIKLRRKPDYENKILTVLLLCLLTCLDGGQTGQLVCVSECES